jgi:hypothetical protein
MCKLKGLHETKNLALIIVSLVAVSLRDIWVICSPEVLIYTRVCIQVQCQGEKDNKVVIDVTRTRVPTTNQHFTPMFRQDMVHVPRVKGHGPIDPTTGTGGCDTQCPFHQGTPKSR